MPLVARYAKAAVMRLHRSSTILTQHSKQHTMFCVGMLFRRWRLDCCYWSGVARVPAHCLCNAYLPVLCILNILPPFDLFCAAAQVASLLL
jgi:hypothetical protein